ncbi:hypothetical protein EKO04_007583 [Ascochyta lentis]|uniref:Heterokaryon incompatibility domain-containing protein n=1 Tax=Ascochyta lentis TaxID=205686 RepID=A0A8H7J3D4_9PLEO|nr:hypothetical protein EKO04_007583 [Ascochyta lentis]
MASHNHSRALSTASLFQYKFDHTYQLEIDLRQDPIRIQHVFHLKQRNHAITSPDQHSVHVIYRPLGRSPSRPDTLTIPSSRRECAAALEWLKKCSCYSPGSHPFYPSRLLSLEQLKASNAANENSPSAHNNTAVTVSLVETKSWHGTKGKAAGYGGGNKQYVTLSHCWGGAVSHQLIRENYDDFVRGILIKDLPKTFQDAVYFAASIEEVGYIWIDSLCIIQRDAQDWLEQSAVMDRVYSETFLNLSATASLNSNGGLFRQGDFEELEETEVLLDIEGLPLACDRKALTTCPVKRKRHFLRRCVVVDISFWANKVEKGPVNTRGWVLQERLMSPRVLHFCWDQIGWECCCSGDTQVATVESTHPKDPKSQQSRYHNIIEGIRQKTIGAHNGADTTTQSPLDLWAAVVNTYTKTAISFPKDKLIAISGLAKIIAEETKCGYVAGLWRKDIEIQLLWFIEPAFDRFNRSFSNPAKIPGNYYAPSFSWAAVDVTGHGITYARIANRSLLIRIEDVAVQTLTDNEFGLVSKARIVLWGKLREARLVSRPKNRFGWHLVNRNDLDDELHTNVYLDCPQRDLDCIDTLDTQVFILPIAREVGEVGTSRNEYLLCLILRSDQEMGSFRRIGITKLSPHGDRIAMRNLTIDGDAGYKILEVIANDAMLPHDGNYDRRTGMHRFAAYPAKVY